MDVHAYSELKLQCAMILRRKKTILFTGIYFFILVFIINTFRLARHDYSTKQVKVLILTYMRSGSSLTGDILQHSQGSFYVYEPLRPFCPSVCGRVISTDLLYVNGSKRLGPVPFHKEAYSTLYKWFSCSISQLPTLALMDVFLGKGQKTSMFISCYTSVTVKTLNHTYAMQVCAKKLEGICDKSPVRIIKTIRANLTHVKQLLHDFPDLKLIHLFRDPRATLFSQSHFNMCLLANNGRNTCSQRLCERLKSDIHEKELLSNLYPNRILTVKYEDLARFPIETSQKMYDFIGVRMTSPTKYFIFNKTMAGNKDDCSICSTRSNSSAHVDSWKGKMNREFLDIVNKNCEYVLKHLGYEEYPAKYSGG